METSEIKLDGSMFLLSILEREEKDMESCGDMAESQVQYPKSSSMNLLVKSHLCPSSLPFSSMIS
jgi:hypothetical protein